MTVLELMDRHNVQPSQEFVPDYRPDKALVMHFELFPDFAERLHSERANALQSRTATKSAVNHWLSIDICTDLQRTA